MGEAILNRGKVQEEGHTQGVEASGEGTYMHPWKPMSMESAPCNDNKSLQHLYGTKNMNAPTKTSALP